MAPKIAIQVVFRTPAPNVPSAGCKTHLESRILKRNVIQKIQGKKCNPHSACIILGSHRYKGLYHVFHQCCQNHWDHVVSKDLAHWTRLPPPLEPCTRRLKAGGTCNQTREWFDEVGSWDGATTILAGCVSVS